MRKGFHDKVSEAMGLDIKEELDALSREQLKQKVVSANQSMKQVEDELERNSKYQEIKAQKKALELGKKEVFRRQKAIIQYSLRLMEEMDCDVSKH